MSYTVTKTDLTLSKSAIEQFIAELIDWQDSDNNSLPSGAETAQYSQYQPAYAAAICP